jgi:hypothetical protein
LRFTLPPKTLRGSNKKISLLRIGRCKDLVGRRQTLPEFFSDMHPCARTGTLSRSQALELLKLLHLQKTFDDILGQGRVGTVQRSGYSFEHTQQASFKVLKFQS